MTNAAVEGFRMLAKAMLDGEPNDWQWNGEHLSQQMYGITERRARNYAERHGGTSKQMISREGGKFLSEAAPVAAGVICKCGDGFCPMHGRTPVVPVYRIEYYPGENHDPAAIYAEGSYATLDGAVKALMTAHPGARLTRAKNVLIVVSSSDNTVIATYAIGTCLK